MNAFLSIAVTIFFSGPVSHTFKACVRAPSVPQVCESPNAATGSSNGVSVYLSHTFRGLKPAVDYEFTYKDNDVESYPMRQTFDVDSMCPQTECPAPTEWPVMTCPDIACRLYPPDEDIWNENDPYKQLWRAHWEACALNNYQLYQALAKCH